MSRPTIAALVTVRKNSQRCKNKMLRPFAGTTLVDLALKRLESLEGFRTKYFAAHEEEFLEKVKGYRLDVLQRRYESANDLSERINQIFDFLVDVPEDYIMWINSSHAFLSSRTIAQAVQMFFEKECLSLTSVVKSRGWYYTMEGTPINNVDPMNISTKITPPVYEVAHAFHIFNRKYLLEHAAYWRNLPRDPFLFEIPEEERFDIDTDEEFQVAEKIYLVRKNNQGMSL